jgi:site-specific DNA-methyltransferase (adenine-specific)
MNPAVMFSSKTDKWATPQNFFDKLNDEFGFTLDPCADDSNHKCAKCYTKEQDGLKQDWSGEIVFCNPPYGKEISLWVQKCFCEVYSGDCPCAVMLIPSRTDTRWFHKYIYNQAEIRFIKGRLKFGDSNNAAPFPSMVVVFQKNKGRTDNA